MLLTLLCSLVVIGSGAVSAQEATPGASPVAGMTCDVEPRTADEILALWYGPDGAPIGTWATPVAEDEAMEITVPIGEPVDAATTEAITAAVQQVFACFDAGNFLGAYALFSDNLVASFGPEPGTTFEDAQAFVNAPAEPAPPEEHTEIVRVANAMVLADGRVAAFVVERYAGADSISFAIFAEEDGAWLVDEVIEFPASDDE